MSAKDLTAIDVPFSSTVGKCVMFTDPSGAVVAQIGIMAPNVRHPYRETVEAVAARIIETWNRADLAPQSAEGPRWQGISTAPRDGTPMIVAVPDRHRTGWIVGEAYFDPESHNGGEIGDWWWAGTNASDHYSAPISEMNHWMPELWYPMPEPATAPVTEGGE